MLVLPRNSSLQMLASPPLSARAEAGCLLSATRPARYKPPAAGAWLDPANWRLDADSEAEAESPVPHSERVPCQQDRAVFPEDMTYKVSVRDADVTVAGVSINGNALDEVGLRAVFRSQVTADWLAASTLSSYWLVPAGWLPHVQRDQESARDGGAERGRGLRHGAPRGHHLQLRPVPGHQGGAGH